MEETGLDSIEAMFYTSFCDSANLSDRIVMPGNVTYDLCNLIESFGFEVVKNKKTELYNYWENIFVEKGLVQNQILQNGNIYPVIKGYFPYDDPRLYVAYRRKGEKEWNGRMSTGILLDNNLIYPEPLWTIHHGYEFREPFVKQLLEN